MPRVKSIHHSYLEISVFNHLSRFSEFYLCDLRWPLIFTKNTRIHLLTITDSHAKYDNYSCFLTCDIVFTRFWFLTSDDLTCPLTATKNDNVLLSTWCIHIQSMKVSIIPTFRYRVYKPSATNTHTTHRDCIDSFCLWRGKKKPILLSCEFVLRGTTCL